MRRVGAAACGLMWVWCGVGMAQSGLDGQGTELHANVDLSSMSSIAAMIRTPVVGAPYAAMKVTKTVWKLGDGTTITRESSTNVARDGEGRIREEIQNTSASSLGGKQRNRTIDTISIADPVDHTITTLSRPPIKTAFRMKLPDVAEMKTPSSGLAGVITAHPPPPPPPKLANPANNAIVYVNAPPVPKAATALNGPKRDFSGGGVVSLGWKDEVKTEELGEQSLGGVVTMGKRTTTVIPAGEIGNDQPIRVTHEEWYSPDLKVVVKSRDFDPRSGERTMELVGLSREEPEASLFKVPEGYTVRDLNDLTKAFEHKPVVDK